MKTRLFSFILFFLLCSVAMAQRKVCLDSDWQFLLGDGSKALSDSKICNTWRTLDLPHDWSMETEASAKAGGIVVGPFSTNSVGGYQTGYTVGGEGWYMKRLAIKKEDLKRQLYTLYFEGAYNETDVYVNGKHCYFNPYGYSSFRVDVNHALREGENIVLVRVRNEGNNSRWYAGSGIYRHVWLITTPQLHLDEWSTYVEVRNEDVQVNTNGEANVQFSIQTKVFNETGKRRAATVNLDILDREGKVIATEKQQVRLEANGSQLSIINCQLTGVHLWSPDIPYLYRARLRVTNETTKVTDTLTKSFGVRSLSFSADKGFLLNGQPTLLQGGCVHHDNGLLGACAYDWAEERKLGLLKAQGFNAVRASHGMPSEYFLDVCDSLGLMVIDEAFDQWILEKNHEDYHRYFVEYSDRDLQSMVLRDRNHPCIVMWSIGNEIPGRIEPEGLATAKRLRQIILNLDTTRPVTAAICGWDAGDSWNAAGSNWDIQDAHAFESLDVGGYNYLFSLYERDHGTHPNRVICGLESYPKQLSQNWDLVERHPYVIGDFVWTAMDYIGEAGIGSASYREQGGQTMFQSWPWYNGWCGDIDLIGQKKPQSYYRDVVWRNVPVTMAVERPAPAGTHQSISAWGWQLEEQSWTYPDLDEHSMMNVNVYSRAPKVRLYLNGESMGDHIPGDTYWTSYNIPYHRGSLRVVNLNSDGKEMEGEEFVLQTTSEPVRLRLSADRTAIHKEGNDLAYVTIELVDAEGRVVSSNSELKLNLKVSGDGVLLASGNASPTDMESFRSTQPRLFRGRALAILKGNDTVGKMSLAVEADGLPSTSIEIHAF